MDNYDAGRRDGIVGCYDKWYRRNQADQGTEYDRGYRAAVEVRRDENFHLIEGGKK